MKIFLPLLAIMFLSPLSRATETPRIQKMKVAVLNVWPGVTSGLIGRLKPEFYFDVSLQGFEQRSLHSTFDKSNLVLEIPVGTSPTFSNQSNRAVPNKATVFELDKDLINRTLAENVSMAWRVCFRVLEDDLLIFDDLLTTGCASLNEILQKRGLQITIRDDNYWSTSHEKHEPTDAWFKINIAVE